MKEWVDLILFFLELYSLNNSDRIFLDEHPLCMQFLLGTGDVHPGNSELDFRD